MNNITPAVLVIGHGSRVSEANNTLFDVARTIKAKGGYDIVQPAFLQFEYPNFSQAVDILVREGARKIIVHPYFLYMGAHVKKDLPFEMEEAKKKYPDIEIVLAPHLGYHEKLVEIAVERIEEVRSSDSPSPEPSPSWGEGKVRGQHPIELESFRLIGEQLDGSRFNANELPIVKRLIHTTADFEYADLARFGNDAIESGIDAILKGADIITDVKMVEAGISRERVDRFCCRVRCFVSDEDVKERAKKDDITRTAAAIRKAMGLMDGGIIVIGNAPTALIEAARLIREGKAAPALIIGVPVGFVGAEESKEMLMQLDVPYISIKGKKGGSTAAVAIVNALLMLAEEKKNKIG